MTPHAAFSIHGDIIRYRGEDVAQLLTPYTITTELFLRALHSIPDKDIDTLEQDITNLQAEIDFLKLEAAKALKFVNIGDLLTVIRILERIVTDAD